MSDALPANDLATALERLPTWSGSTTSIERTVTAASFMAAVRLVDEVAVEAERANHHPDIDIRWRRVRFALSTHDAGGVTELDLALAAQIDDLAAAGGAT